MYTPDEFRPARRSDVHRVIDESPLAVLVSPGESPEIAHAPALLARDRGEHGKLSFHLARANPLAATLARGGPLTAVFCGPDAYVSAAWYEQPAVQVPTWNYIAVHASGTVRAATDGELRDLLERLASRHEPEQRGWRPAQLDPGLFTRLLARIQGFVMPIQRLEAKFKLSQNRSRADRGRVRQGLIRRDRDRDLDVAEWMAILEPV